MQPHESPPKLPSNILLHVVDSLRHDLPTLRRCALTSHFLHDYLRPLLCNKVTIAQPWVSRAFELSTFLDDSPSFGALVKHLKIAGPEGTPLERVLAPEGILAVAPKLPAVRTLTLELLAFDYLEDLFHVIAAFPHLETLCINGLLLEDHFETGRLASEEPRFYPTAAAFPPLRSLNIRWGMGYGERPFVRKLLDYKTSLRLQSLVVTFSEVVHQQAPYETYLPDIGESLHHVSISGTSTEHPSSYLHPTHDLLSHSRRVVPCDLCALVIRPLSATSATDFAPSSNVPTRRFPNCRPSRCWCPTSPARKSSESSSLSDSLRRFCIGSVIPLSRR
ncbi:hypothetical protein C8T65DRAFT_664889 [Cerioporus squamosus]|nr:hypothetical protein C8T65DRAFT_664889 [Cerioporus squamosus]